MIQRIFLTSSGVLLLGCAAGFFLFVSPISILTVAFLMIALMLMFGLGFQIGARELVTVHGQVTAFGYSRRLFLQLHGEKTEHLQHSQVGVERA
jgi:hypothetical protein